MAAPTITEYSGSIPQRTQAAATFATNADDWLTYQTGQPTEYNALAVYVDALAVTMDADATAAAASAAAALASETAASASTNFVGAWSAQTGAANVPYSVAHNSITLLLLNNLADVTTSEPSVTSDWQAIDPNFYETLKTADFNISAGLRYQTEATSATIDGTLPATLTDGQKFTFHNSSASTYKVQILNPNFTIRGPAGSIASGTNLEISAGDTAELVAKGTLILEVA